MKWSVELKMCICPMCEGCCFYSTCKSSSLFLCKYGCVNILFHMYSSSLRHDMHEAGLLWLPWGALRAVRPNYETIPLFSFSQCTFFVGLYLEPCRSYIRFQYYLEVSLFSVQFKALQQTGKTTSGWCDDVNGLVYFLLSDMKYQVISMEMVEECVM